MNTRDKILATALHLFNTHGTSGVTVRHIAKEMGISHGNLCYHFPRTEDIIQQLYLNLVAEIDRGFHLPQGIPPDVLFLLQILQHTFETLSAYRFLMLDFVRIMRTLPAVKLNYQALYQRRLAQVNVIREQLVASGDFQPEQYPGQHEHFVAQCFLLSDFWLAEAEILFDAPGETKLAYYLRLAGGVLFQYLTPQGQTVLRPLLTPA
ncbi:TetR/AcrR family transcriptional regulator [Hymenobacter bucti]|uniref:TetR/AcrR family transcriptional regulator n=1 Tax=Hymenobacter bucti TaxID=1844114 RepID=A0ABW4QNZ6_9BACT